MNVIDVSTLRRTTFGIDKTSGMYSIVLEYTFIYFSEVPCLEYKQFQQTIRKHCALEPNDIIIKFLRKGIELFLERKMTIIPRDLALNILARCRLYQYDFVIVYYH